MITDIVSILSGFFLVGLVNRGNIGSSIASDIAQMLLPLFLTVALYNGSYSVESLANARKGVWRASCSVIVATALLLFVLFYFKAVGDLSRAITAFGAAVAVLAISWSRLQMRAFVRWRCGAAVINELIIDDMGPPVAIPGSYTINAAAFELIPDLDSPHALDRIGKLLRNADRVIVSTPPERRLAWAVVLRGADVAGEVVDERVGQLNAYGARTKQGLGLLQVSTGPLSLKDRISKRVLDLVISGSAILLLGPLLAIVSLLIKLEDGGPVFFIQQRVGRSNRFFKIYKFRSMSVNKVGLNGSLSASKDDKRITRIGRIIRSTSIDELPQLFNVLFGDMSLVGPRPHAIGSQAGNKLFWEVDMRYWERHALRPGLTGLAQVRGLRGATECEADLTDRLDADLEYVNGWTLLRDISILFATFKVLIHDRAF